MKSFKSFITEAEFTYKHSIKYRWISLTEEAMKKFNIRFDLENFDPVGEVKTYKPKVDTSFDTSFTYQMQKGGGDWQTTTISFRCQLTNGFLKDVKSYSNVNDGCFVFIPNFEEGNNNLIKSDKGVWVPKDNNSKDYGKQDEEKCEKSLKLYLDKLVVEYEDSRKNK